MIKKKIAILFSLCLIFISCSQEETPKGIIEKQKMINVMVDMQITDSYLNQVSNKDTMMMQAHTRYNYIFKKYGIDSAQFSRSLAYYSDKPDEFNKMFNVVLDSLNSKEVFARQTDSLRRVMKSRKDSIAQIKLMKKDSLLNKDSMKKIFDKRKKSLKVHVIPAK
ncbi:MAG: DUF4296 domain-containing protein [Sphingobacteriales bacterium]|nr:DUF4296 domain-containing protein [Sphingobacteriales bacterium]